MLTKNQIKYIQSLAQKKVRDAEGVFVAEGNKLVSDLLSLFSCRMLVATTQFLNDCKLVNRAETVIEASHDEICKASLLNAPQQVIAVFEKPKDAFSLQALSGHLTLMLDRVQDPGNLGTIIRIADWFGIRQIICSADTADVYNPKVVQATMGAIGRVSVHYDNLVEVLSQLKGCLPVYGTFLEGNNIYAENLQAEGIIVMGNEGNGISDAVKNFVTDKLFIPNYPVGEPTSESLNVAVATAITCAEFRRRIFK